MIKKFNIFIALFLILGNIYFLFITISILFTAGGSFGYGVLLLPFTFLTHLFLIPSILALKKKHRKNHILLIINSIGTAYIIFIIVSFLSYS
ncbi:hypothetical protein H9W90_09730 [Polaribacter pectinis]|uniref:Uncharacterized protein n=1 Tax=Polaribacter pectinis TaxID=2738844 RepID=A0A7G9L777_9FLAO|nr:hypothetical protein [Polaribacter pectinis]QNM84476.1 hypothetical protein H9W90_09730 [Polaribacter pectinis]